MARNAKRNDTREKGIMVWGEKLVHANKPTKLSQAIVSARYQDLVSRIPSSIDALPNKNNDQVTYDFTKEN